MRHIQIIMNEIWGMFTRNQRAHLHCLVYFLLVDILLFECNFYFRLVLRIQGKRCS